MKGGNGFQNGDDGGKGDEERGEDMNEKCCLRGGGLFQEHIQVLVPRGLHVLDPVHMVVPQVLGIVGTVEGCIIGGRGSCCRYSRKWNGLRHKSEAPQPLLGGRRRGRMKSSVCGSLERDGRTWRLPWRPRVWLRERGQQRPPLIFSRHHSSCCIALS